LKCRSKYAEVLILKKSDFMKLKNDYTNNIFDVLEESSADYKIMNIKRKIISELFKLKVNTKNIKRKYKELIQYFLNKQFTGIFESSLSTIFDNFEEIVDKELPNIQDFQVNNENTSIREALNINSQKDKDFHRKEMLGNYNLSIRNKENIGLLNKNSNPESLNNLTKKPEVCIDSDSIIGYIKEKGRKRNNHINFQSNKSLNSSYLMYDSLNRSKITKNSLLFNDKTIEKNCQKIINFIDTNIRRSETESVYSREKEFNKKINYKLKHEVEDYQSTYHRQTQSIFSSYYHLGKIKKDISQNEYQKFPKVRFENLSAQKVVDLNLLSQTIKFIFTDVNNKDNVIEPFFYSQSLSNLGKNSKRNDLDNEKICTLELNETLIFDRLLNIKEKLKLLV
jgi:hypothetical protein